MPKTIRSEIAVKRLLTLAPLLLCAAPALAKKGGKADKAEDSAPASDESAPTLGAVLSPEEAAALEAAAAQKAAETAASAEQAAEDAAEAGAEAATEAAKEADEQAKEASAPAAPAPTPDAAKAQEKADATKAAAEAPPKVPSLGAVLSPEEAAALEAAAAQKAAEAAAGTEAAAEGTEAAAPADGAAPIEGAPGAEALAAEAAAKAAEQPTVPAVVMTPEIAQATFDAERLERRTLELSDPTREELLRIDPVPEAYPWSVFRGNGASVSARNFAEATQDTRVLTDMDRSRKRAKFTALGLGIGGGVLVASAVVPMLMMEPLDGYPESTPQQDQYTDAAQYIDDLEGWRTRQTVEGRNQNRVFTGIALGTTGIMALSLAPFTTRGAKLREEHVALYYTPDEALARIDRHNNLLEKEYGLVAPEPTKVQIGKKPTEQNEAPLEDGSDLPEDEDVGIPEGDDLDLPEPPGGGGPPLEPGLELHPVIGFGTVGLHVTF